MVSNQDATASPVDGSDNESINALSKTKYSLILDPEDPFDQVIIRMVETNRRKRADYAGDNHFLFNFYETARQLELTAGHAVETLISTKQARLRVLLSRHWNEGIDAQPQNEPISDTLLDRAVYSVLALCLWNTEGYSK